ncbi:hypothetical protein [Paenarthrobacter sp. NPDC058040]|uniref:hypothetical protein n=1 Tax=unclassified Paenarthrobacter TaxID=2634190 RepID=UPI0036DBEFAC
MYRHPSPIAPQQRPTNPNVTEYERQVSRAGGELLACGVFDLDSIFSEAAADLLEAKNRSVLHKWKGNHWLCGVLWNAAELLIHTEPSELVGKTAKELCHKAKVPRFVANVIGKVETEAINSVLPSSPTKLAYFMKVLVALICADTNYCAHGQKAIYFLLEPELVLSLREFTA